jgi:DNA-binding winged helix-turn-helix (wHTH) protein
MPESRGFSPGRQQARPIGPATVKFGPFTLDLESRKLRRGDEPIYLPSRAFGALAYLIEHRDRLVDREEIIVELTS